MSDAFVYQPPRQPGLAIQAAMVALLTLFGVFSLWQATRASIGPLFLLYLLPALLALGLAPFIAYRAYAGFRTFYTLERDGLHLRWGLRLEDIPMDAVTWVRPVGELGFALPLPWLRWPGAIVGSRRLRDGVWVEFMATSARHLLVIATPGRMYAISPSEPAQFLNAFRRFAELGTLSPLPWQSVHPSFLLARVWSDRLARFLLVAGALLLLVLLTWVSLVIPGRVQVSLGFRPDGSPGDPVPAVQLFMLPVLDAFFFVASLVLGLFFYRWVDRRGLNRTTVPGLVWLVLAYLLWGSSALTSLFFLAAVAYLT